MSRKINVTKLRKALGLTQAQMAARLGIHQATVHKLEKGYMKPSGPVQRLLDQMAAAISATQAGAE